MLTKRKKIIKNNREPLKRWVWSLITIFFVCIFSYGYFIREMTVNVVTRVAMESELSSLNSKVSNLESEYIKARNNITLEKAQSMGFVTVVNQKFVNKDVKNPGLSLLTTGL